MRKSRVKLLYQQARRKVRAFLRWVHDHVPPGLRLVLGCLMMVGGVFGFLPILGWWMLPAGVAVAAMDIKPVWRWFRRRAQTRRDKARHHREDHFN